jgi:guanine deaminase
MEDHSHYMRRAIALADRSMRNHEGGPFGAVIVKDHTIIGEGWNRVIATNDPTAHGEISAIRDACRKIDSFELSGCSIYTTGEPCPMCLGAIYWARISRIYFGFRINDAADIGFDDTNIFDQFSLAPEQRKIPSSEILRDEAMILASNYQNISGRIAY